MRVRPAIKLLKHQMQFLQCRSFLSYAQGGVGSGKTQGGAAKALDRHVKTPADGMIVAPTWPLLHRVTLRTYLSLLPKKALRYHNKRERFLELVNGHRAYYGSADRPDTLEGTNLGWAWIDEGRYIRRSAFEVMLARMRVGKNPELFITSTPARGWLYDEFGKRKPHRTVVRFRTRDNHHLPPGFLDRLRESLSDTLFEQYVEGEFVLAEGAVFPEFHMDVHVQPNLYDPDWPVLLSYDPGFRRNATIFFQHLTWCPRHNTPHCIHVLDEFLGKDTATVFVAREWDRVLGSHAWQRDRLFVDPAANTRSVSLGTSDVDVLETAGWNVEWVTDPFLRSVSTGIDAMRSKLKPASGNPSLYFDERLDNDNKCGCLRAMTDSVYPEHKEGRAIDENPIKDGEIDHVRDTIRYAIVNTCPVYGASRVEVY